MGNQPTTKREKPGLISPAKRKRTQLDLSSAHRMPPVTPHVPCRLRLLKFERIKDHLLLDQEFLQRVKPKSTTMDDRKESDFVRLMRGSAMRVARLEDLLTDGHAIVSSFIGLTYLPVLSFVDRELLEPGCSVLTNRSVSAVVGVLPNDQSLELSKFKLESAPTETFADVGGLEEQVEELREAVELPLTRPELYEELGVRPPKGVLLYGPPGTGKTLLAKAVANQTKATFIRVAGTDLVKKTAGDGPKLIRNIFKVAARHAPSILFIDEIDAIGSKRFDGARDGENEVQRTLLELLTQLDGFDEIHEVMVIMATNRIDSLDPALIRPGRIDRKIEIPLPTGEKALEHIFQIHSRRMSLAEDVRPDEYLSASGPATDDDGCCFSGADIKALCTEAGMLALRAGRIKVGHRDFLQAKRNMAQRNEDCRHDSLYL